MLAREAEEVDEEAERDRGCDREEDSAAPARVVRTTFLGRGENSSSQSDHRPAQREPGGPFAGGKRDPERDHGPAGGDGRDEAHRPDRERLVVGGEADPAAEAAERCDPEGTRVELEPVGGQPDEERDEPGGLRPDRDGQDRDATREEPAEEVRAAPGEGRSQASAIADML